MNLDELLSNCKTILLPPSIYQSILNSNLDSNDKLFKAWSVYFSQTWSLIANSYRNQINNLCKLFQPLAYQAELYIYLKKHKEFSDAEISYLKHRYVYSHLTRLDNKLYAVFEIPFDRLMVFDSTPIIIEIPLSLDDVKYYIWQQQFVYFWKNL